MARAAPQGVRRATVVEFCGLPGAGKSYVVDLVASSLGDRGIAARGNVPRVGPETPAVTRIGRKLALVGRSAMTRPVESVRTSTQIGLGQNEISDAVTRPFHWLLTQALLSRARRSDGVHLIDEGLVQSLWSVGLRGDVDRVLERLGETPGRWARPDVVVVVDAPLETVRDRLRARRSNHSRTQRLGEEELLAELRRGAELLERLLDWWRDLRGPDGVIDVPNPEGATPNVEAVTRRVPSMPHG